MDAAAGGAGVALTCPPKTRKLTFEIDCKGADMAALGQDLQRLSLGVV